MKKKKTASVPAAQHKRRHWSRDDTELTLLGLPATIWFAVFCYLPMFGLIISFKDFKLVPGKGFLTSLFQSDWCGFKNFNFFLSSNTFKEEGAWIDRKLNVALTRARKQLIITGHEPTLRQNALFAKLLDHIRSREGYAEPQEE